MQSLSTVDIVLLLLAIFLVIRVYHVVRTRLRTTSLRGPRSTNWIFGVMKDVNTGDSGAFFEKWAGEFGPAFSIPEALGDQSIALFDPRAVAHFFSKDTFVYRQTSTTRSLISAIVGRGLLWADADNHKRQRRILNPAFSNSAIRNYLPVFLDAAYKARANWDAFLGSSESGDVIIEVQQWMNRISLDSIGIAGFSHDFEALQGKKSAVAEAFDSFAKVPSRGLMILLMPVLPFLSRLPTPRKRVVRRFHDTTSSIAAELLDRSRKEEVVSISEQKGRAVPSIMSALVNADNYKSRDTLTEEEILAQIRLLILAGYETTSITLTWALIELARFPDKQEKLRTELSRFINQDPTYEQLMTGLPYLDGVAREVLRLHPPVRLISRVAAEDDVVPLSRPATTRSGSEVNEIAISKGQLVRIPIRGLNRSTFFWGDDAKSFVPERWLEGDSGLPQKARLIQGTHHLLTFADGPRTCLGRMFALTEFKAVLSVLVRNFTFALPNGPDTEVETVITLLPRPRIVGSDASGVPLIVKHVT